MNLSALFPDEDYRFALRFERGRPEEFFAPTHSGPHVLEERRHWLEESPDDHVALTPEAGPLLAETLELFRDWPATRPCAPASADVSRAACLELGRRLEPDFLLLRAEPDGAFRLRAGCVCFPSSWSLAEKMGRTLEEIHGIVPGLNAALARPISGFLAKMVPGIAWRRANWGLSRSPDLNQHPRRALARLDAAVRLDDVWLRVEHQARGALPRSGGVLFGIRVEVLALADVLRDPAAATGLRRALRTMPGPVASYKGIAPALAHILSLMSGGLANV